MILQNVPEKYGKEDLGKFICKFCIEQVKTYQLQPFSFPKEEMFLFFLCPHIFFSLPLQKGQFFVFVVILGQVSHPRPRATLLTVFTRSCDFENRGKDN